MVSSGLRVSSVGHYRFYLRALSGLADLSDPADRRPASLAPRHGSAAALDAALLGDRPSRAFAGSDLCGGPGGAEPATFAQSAFRIRDAGALHRRIQSADGGL